MSGIIKRFERAPVQNNRLGVVVVELQVNSRSSRVERQPSVGRHDNSRAARDITYRSKVARNALRLTVLEEGLPPRLECRVVGQLSRRGDVVGCERQTAPIAPSVRRRTQSLAGAEPQDTGIRRVMTHIPHELSREIVVKTPETSDCEQLTVRPARRSVGNVASGAAVV